MHKQSIVILVGVLILVGTALGVQRWAEHSRSALPVEQVLSGEVGRFTVTRTEAIALTQAEGQWTMESHDSYPANTSMITEILEGLRSVTIVGVVAEEETSWQYYGLEEGNGQVLEFDTGDTIRVGGRSSDSQYRYIVMGAGPVVYMVPNSAFPILPATVDGWRSKDILPITIADIQHLTVRKDENTQRSFRQEGVGEWVAQQEITLTGLMESFLASPIPTANGFVTEKEPTGEVLTIVYGTEDSEYTVQVWQEEQGVTYLSYEGAPFVFRVAPVMYTGPISLLEE